MAFAAALLGELLLSRRVTVRDGFVVVVNAAAPADVVAHTILDRLISEHLDHPVRTWLVHLADDAYVEVAGRMERAGDVRACTSRWPLGRSVRYVPTDQNKAGWPWARLNRTLLRGEPLDDSDMILAGLAEATDLHRVALVGDADAFADAVHRQLTEADKPVRELVTHAKAAIGDAVITRT